MAALGVLCFGWLLVLAAITLEVVRSPAVGLFGQVAYVTGVVAVAGVFTLALFSTDDDEDDNGMSQSDATVWHRLSALHVASGVGLLSMVAAVVWSTVPVSGVTVPVVVSGAVAYLNTRPETDAADASE